MDSVRDVSWNLEVDDCGESDEILDFDSKDSNEAFRFDSFIQLEDASNYP